jgi:hypothetical protein
VALAIGFVLIGGAVAYHQVMAGRVDERVATGMAVPATVTDSWQVRGLPDRVVVEYRVESRTYQTTLVALFTASPRATGERVTVFVDRGDPTRVGTAGGYTSQSWWTLLPPVPMGATGVVIVVVAAIQPLRRWRESRADWQPVLSDPGLTPREPAGASPAGSITFDRVRRGYDVQDVQTFLRWFDRVLASDDPQQWERARTALRLTSFRTQFRGYDREQVRDRLARLAGRLERVSGGS